MAVILGRNVRVALSTDDITYNDLGDLQTSTLSATQNLADKTTCDSGGYIAEGYANQQLSVDVQGLYDSSDTAQAALMNEVFSSKSSIYVRVRPATGSASEKEWKFLANVADFKVDMAHAEYEPYSATLRSTGTITYQTQP